MHTVRCGFDGIPTVRYGAVLRNRESFGAVRCGFQILEILRCGSVLWYILRRGSVIFYVLRCGSVRFFYIVQPTVRCGAVFQERTNPTVRFGAVRCGAVFQERTNPTVRFGAVNRTEPHRTDRKTRTVKNPGFLFPLIFGWQFLLNFV